MADESILPISRELGYVPFRGQSEWDWSWTECVSPLETNHVEQGRQRHGFGTHLDPGSKLLRVLKASS